jgi:hypothetical protein
MCARSHSGYPRPGPHAIALATYGLLSSNIAQILGIEIIQIMTANNSLEFNQAYYKLQRLTTRCSAKSANQGKWTSQKGVTLAWYPGIGGIGNVWTLLLREICIDPISRRRDHLHYLVIDLL